MTSFVRFVAALSLLAAVFTGVAFAQPRGFRGGEGAVFPDRIEPHWFAGNSKFWYRNSLPRGEAEWILVDAEAGVRQAAFDHERLAHALRDKETGDVSPRRLPITDLRFANDAKSITFRANGRGWKCDLQKYDLTRDESRPPEASGREIPRVSRRTGEEIHVVFANRTRGEVALYWLNLEGKRQDYGKIAAGEKHEQHTFEGHVWEVVDRNGQTLALIEASANSGTIDIRGQESKTPTAPTRDAPAIDAPDNDAPAAKPEQREYSPRNLPVQTSPDGRWTASIRDFNIVVRERGGKETVLTADGREKLAYGMLDWSPDSQRLVAFRIEPGERLAVNYIESSPRGGGRALLHSHTYELPGDKFASHELCLFDVGGGKRVDCSVDKIDFGTPRLRWNADGHTFTYQKTDRGHQRFRLIEVDSQTGATRNLIDEKTDTFIWSVHNDGLRPITWLSRSGEIVYVSERDGWRHLWLIDPTKGNEGKFTNCVTPGDYVVRGIERIDEEKRQIWFRACGREADQDPYLIHYYRVDFDGTNLVALTAGNGTHTIEFSPDGKYLIDRYSRVDLAPVHELRRASDGKLICELEKADISGLARSGWEAPEVFSAKGRDGKTDIWGIICRPRDFDPAKKYPVIEQIYAGPHGSFVPKSFSSSRRFSALTDLGFVVVQIDGMGTANRSKAFHDVCWKNLKDAGFPDRILWHQAVAAKYPWYDASRVGIYGGSAGGQNSTGALLFHGDFYKAAVSGCGCHDNRMDKASWNEQWMGYPVGPQYAASSNIEHAAQLRGKLMLIVGEMDTNVPPESTYRLCDALIKAGKDFDFVLVPGAGHGMGGAYGDRRMRDFFVRHLQGKEPPERNGG